MPALTPYAAGERPVRSRFDRPFKVIGDIDGADALASLASCHRYKMAAVMAEFPAQAAYLTLCDVQRRGEQAVRRGVVKLAAESPVASARWTAFFAKLAAIAPGVPPISGTQATPTAALPKPLADAPKPPVPLGTPGPNVGTNPTAPMTPTQHAIAAASSVQVGNLRRIGQHDASPVNQLLGTTTGAVRQGLTDEQHFVGQGVPQARATAKANPMAPSNDPTALSYAGNVAKGVPRLMAAGVAALPAAAVDHVRAMSGNGWDYSHTRGALTDLASPFTKGLGVNPYGNAGNKSLFSEIMPDYADRLHGMSQTGGNPVTRGLASVAEPVARYSELASTLAAGGGTSLGAGLATKFPALAAKLPTFATGGMKMLGRSAAYGGAMGAVQGELLPSAMGGTLTEEKAYQQAADQTALKLHGGVNGPPVMSLQPGDNPDMPSQSSRINAKRQADAAEGRAMLGKGPPPAPALQAGDPAAPTQGVVPQTSQEAAQRLQAASAGLTSLTDMKNSGASPQELAQHFQARMEDHITSIAATTGMKPEAIRAQGARFMEDKQLDDTELAAWSKTPAAGEVAKEAQAKGIDPVKSVTDFWGQLSSPQRFLVGAGLGLAVIGSLSAAFGGGGLMSMIMALLGGGAAAAGSGLFSGASGGQAGAWGQEHGLDQVGDFFSGLGGGGDKAPAPAPAPAPAAAPAPAPGAMDYARHVLLPGVSPIHGIAKAMSGGGAAPSAAPTPAAAPNEAKFQQAADKYNWWGQYTGMPIVGSMVEQQRNAQLVANAKAMGVSPEFLKKHLAVK